MTKYVIACPLGFNMKQANNLASKLLAITQLALQRQRTEHRLVCSISQRIAHRPIIWLTVIDFGLYGDKLAQKPDA